MTALTAAVAGFFGARLGAGNSRREAAQISLQTVVELIERSGVQLRANQKSQLAALARDFYVRQHHNSEQLHQATVRVSEMLTQTDGSQTSVPAMVDEMAPLVRERYTNTVVFLSEARSVLDTQQREPYDSMIRKLFAEAPN